MKKLFIFIVCLIMLSNSAAAVSAKELKSSYTMIDFLETIGIINTETDSADDFVTREVFAVYVARMLCIDENGASGSRYFADLENNAFSAKSVNALTERGIISIPEDRYFRPGEDISYNEAVKMLVSAAGYDIYAARKGGYPQGYRNIADSLKIQCRVKNQNQITVIEAAELIYKTLVAPVCTLEVMNGTSSDFTAEDSLIAKQFDILWQEGTVSKIAGQSTKSDGALALGKAEIGSVIYDISEDFDADGLIGSYVKFFYKDDGISGEIIFISDDVKKTEDIEIDIDLLEDFTGGAISYYKSYDSTKTVKTRLENAVLVYNGICLGEDIKAVMAELNKGSITLKDGDNDGAYDTVIIKDYKNFIVGSVDDKNEKLFNKLNTEPKEIACEEFDAVTVKDEMGNRLDIADIANQAAASVAASKDGRSFIEIVVSTTEFNGEIESIDEGELYPYVIINSEKYMVDKSYFDEFKLNIKVGNTYYFKTDIFGKIAYVNTGSTKNYSMGYVRNIGCNDETENCFMRLLTENCTFETFMIDEKVKIDGQKYKSPETIKTALDMALDVGDNSIKNRFVCYVLNDEGYITEIDTLAMNSSFERKTNSLTAVYALDNTEKVFTYGGVISNTTRNFGRNALITPKTTIFLLPGGVETPELDECYVGVYSNMMKENIKYTGNAYKLSSLNTYADVVLARYDAADLEGNTNGTKAAFLVDKVYRGVNSDNEIIQYVYGYENGVKKTLEASEDVDLKGLKRGDVVRFEYNIKGNISKRGIVEKLYDPEEEYPNWGIDFVTGCRLKVPSDYTNVFQISFGNVVRAADNCVFWAAEGYEDAVDSVELSSINIAVYDSDESTVTAGTINDIYDAESRGTACSKIMYVTRDNVGKCVYIFN